MSNIKQQFNEFVSYVEEYIQHSMWYNQPPRKGSDDIPEATYRLELVLELVPKIKQGYRSILDQLHEDEKLTCIQHYAKFESSYIPLISDWKNVLKTFEQKSKHKEKDTDEENIKVPVVKIPEFDGSFSQWIEFRDTFETMIHRSKKLSKIEKFLYLKSAIKLPSGQPNILLNYPISEGAYEQAWQAVKQRYNDKVQLKSDLFDSLFTVKKMTIESAPELRRIIDHFNATFGTLDTLRTTNDDFRIHLVLRKLDDTTHKDWAKHIGGREANWNMFSEFLTSQWGSLRRIPQPIKKMNPTTYQKPLTSSSKAMTASASNSSPCSLCKGSHRLYQCEKFISMMPHERLNCVKSMRCCVNCLSPYHHRTECRNSSRCKQCNKDHHTMLHLDFNSAPQHSNNSNHQNTSEASMPSAHEISDEEEVSSEQQSSYYPPASSERFEPPPKPRIKLAGQQKQTMTTLSATTNFKKKKVMLSTICFNVNDHEGSLHRVRALLDSGSDTNFITSKLAAKLRLPLANACMVVNGVNDNSLVANQRGMLDISSRNSKFHMKIECFVLTNITGNIPSNQLDVQLNDFPLDKTLADPEFHLPGQIDMLVGADVFYEALMGEKYRLPQGPYLVQTSFGWIVGGEFLCKTPRRTFLSCYAVNDSLQEEEVNQKLDRFMEIEQGILDTKMFSPEEVFCQKLYDQTTHKDENGRYIVELPFKKNISHLRNNFNNAYHQFLYQEKLRQKDEDLNSLYVAYINNLIAKGFAEEVENLNQHDGYYLPHHAVKKVSSTTTKVRPVFNGSSKSETSLSLNDCLCVGPTVQPESYEILIRFREPTYVFRSDVEMMYMQFFVHPHHRKYQKILWRNNSTEKIKHLQINSVTFGLAPSAYLSTRSLNQIAYDNKNSFPKASNIILSSFYVDDLLFGMNSIKEAKCIRDQIRLILLESKLNARKWTSNCAILIEDLPSHLKEDISSVATSVKTLGHNWFPKTDSLSLNFKSDQNEKVTKAAVLSMIASIYDPLGLVGPVILRAKVFMKTIHQLKIKWDQQIPDSVKNEWNEFVNRIPKLNEVKINRRVVLPDHISIEFHVFADTSEHAYGAAAYVRSADAFGNVQVRLISSKSRVSPPKQQTIARLELCSCLLLTKLAKKITDCSSLIYENITLWSDSMITLFWITKAPEKLSTFVGNRAAAIQDISTQITWKHIKTEENLADVISRGLMPDEINECDAWWNGPTFLHAPESEWPETLISINEDDPIVTSEQRKGFKISQVNPLFQFIERRFSRIKILINTIAYAKRFINNCKVHTTSSKGVLSIKEKENALLDITRIVQQSLLSCEYSFFEKILNEPNAQEKFLKKSSIYSLFPYRAQHHHLTKLSEMSEFDILSGTTKNDSMKDM